MNKAPSDMWFTVQVRFDREHGSIEISRPYIHEIEIIDDMFYLRDKNGKDMEEHKFDEVEWYKVKPQESINQPEVYDDE